MNVEVKRFDELSNDLLYDMLALRSQVFVVEQQSIYLDCDGHDKQSIHVLLLDQQQLSASARVLPAGTLFDKNPAIGRVVVHPDRRGEGLGHALMQEALAVCKTRYPESSVRISAQQHLQSFYESHGFAVVSEPYLEDGIWHVAMLREAD